MTMLNAWPEHDTAPCARDGEHHASQRHPFPECPTYAPPAVAPEVAAARAALTAASRPFQLGQDGDRGEQTRAALLVLALDAREHYPTATHLRLVDSDQGLHVFVGDVLADGVSLVGTAHVCQDVQDTHLYDDSREHWLPFTDLGDRHFDPRYSVDGVPGGVHVLVDVVLGALGSVTA